MDAQHRVHELLSELSELIGPGVYYEIAEPAMLSEWVAVLSWVDQNGQSYVTTLGSYNLVEHHATGLLYTAMNGEFGIVYEEED